MGKSKYCIRSLAAAGLLIVFATGLQALPRRFTLFDSTRIAGNSIVEIIYQPSTGAVWLATERGLSRTSDNGKTWQNFDKDNTGDLLSNEIAALGLRNDTLWAATSFTRVFGNQTDGFQAVPFGTGFAVSGNNGATWTHFTPDQDSGAGMLAFDIAISDSAVWAASFFGGLVRSTDQGTTWKNAFSDSIAYFDFQTQSFIDRNDRFFSVVADTFRRNPVTFSQDTIVIWGGTAAGLNQFFYFSRKIKLADNYILSIAYDSVRGRYWFGTANGLTYTPDTGRSFVTLDATAGIIDTGAVSALYADGAQILAAVSAKDSLRTGAGLFRSTDGGASWSRVDARSGLGVPYDSGSGRVIRQIVKTDSGFYAAADKGGFLFSRNGVSWQNLFPDSVLPKKENQFLSVAPFRPSPDSLLLLAGSRKGLATFVFTGRPDSFISLTYLLADTNTFAGNRIEKVAVNKFKDMVLTYWVISHPDTLGEGFSVNRSTDRGATWKPRFVGIPAYDIAFQDSTLWLGVRDSLIFSSNNGDSLRPILVRDTVSQLSLVRLSVPTLFARPGLVWAGTINGLAVTTLFSGQNWNIFRTEKEEAQKVERFFYNQSVVPSVPGNFVVALGVQKTNAAKVIWAGAHQTDISGERNGVAWSTDDGATWKQTFLDTLAWNFAFWGDTVWVATSSGLFRSPNTGQSWEYVQIVDTAAGTSFSNLVEILSVRQINDSTVWAGSTDGAAVSFDLGRTWTIFRRFVSVGKGPGTADADVYVSPVPFSPLRGLGNCRFHYRPAQNSNVTIEIFDFSMRRVKTVIKDAPRFCNIQCDTDEWDGKNEKGDLVANGTYFFRVDFGNEKKWGKLVVLK